MERRIDRRFRNRFIVRTAVLLVPPLAAFAFMWSDDGRSGRAVLMAAIFFAAWIGGWIVLDMLMFRTYRCPSCGKRMSRSATAITGDGDPIRYRCPACAVEWDTGLREARD